VNTISSDYLTKQKELHQNPRYGSASVDYAPIIIDILETTGFRSICDYGAGKCRLGVILKKKMPMIDYFPYDPAFPEYGPAKPAELVACIDVLEHIEPEFLENVIQELSCLTTHVGFFSIHTGPAKKTLADGRNAHLIQKPASWWLERLLPYFDIIQLTPVKRGFWVIVQHKGSDHTGMFVKRKRDYAALWGKLQRFVRRRLFSFCDRHPESAGKQRQLAN
jgi:hypothetical protein